MLMQIGVLVPMVVLVVVHHELAHVATNWILVYGCGSGGCSSSSSSGGGGRRGRMKDCWTRLLVSLATIFEPIADLCQREARLFGQSSFLLGSWVAVALVAVLERVP